MHFHEVACIRRVLGLRSMKNRVGIRPGEKLLPFEDFNVFVCRLANEIEYEAFDASLRPSVVCKDKETRV